MTKMIQRRSPPSRPVYDVQPVGNGVFRVVCTEIGYEYDQCMTEAVVMELFQHKPIVIDAERLARKIRENPDEGCVEAGWMHPEAPR